MNSGSLPKERWGENYAWTKKTDAISKDLIGSVFVFL